MAPLEIPTNDPRPGLAYPMSETRLHRLIVQVARWFLGLFMILQVSGLENLPTAGAAVVAANHLVAFDVFPVQLALPRMVFFMGKAELFQIGFVHSIFRQMGGFPVYRGEHDTWAFEHAQKLLAASQIVAMFPEGTRSRGKGLTLARPGAARLAIEMGCPLVAISVDGIQHLFKKFPQRTVVQVVIAAPIIASRNESPLSLTDALMFTMAKNLPQGLRGAYAQMPKGFE